MTERDLAEALGIGPESVRIACTKLEKRDQIHVSGYDKRPNHRWPRIWSLGPGRRADKNDPPRYTARRYTSPEFLDRREPTRNEDAMIARAKVRGLTWWGAL